MKTIEEIKTMKEEKLKRIFGVNRKTFFVMLEKLNEQFINSHKRGGRPPKIDVLNRLCIFFAYYKSYRTMEEIANEYQISVSTTYDIIRLVEKTLSSCCEFQLPDEKFLTQIEHSLIIDSTECEIQRPKKGAMNITVVKRKNIRKRLKY